MNHYSTDEAYQKHILTGVSRTFALTIPQLPADLYTVVGNAYLLCRIADTIEDEPQLTPAQKQLFSQQFIHVVAGTEPPQPFSDQLLPLLSSSTTPAEKDLILHTNHVIRLTHSFTATQQISLHRCVSIMAEGMSVFQQSNTLAGLQDVTELNRYCYYVAGVVGEMLTDLFCEYSPDIAKNRQILQPLAVSFGQALQMTNILKDIWDDRSRGACWLPQTVFQQAGFDIRQLDTTSYSPAFGDGLQYLIGIAHYHLIQSLHYILLIPPKETGIRRFCLWALGMAILTLRNINQHPQFTSGQQVKISRRWVKATLLISNLSVKSNITLRTLFYLLTRGLPAPHVS
ncbi:phytoene/squalene synthase family protein [Beggiatoa leptomitoformis]|uniref:Phytoene synthase n=1 Tax=Beggiatoa leptomitoformis TaxID=288004 RepID=A0A650GDV8_9GAMM|nr:phytoene/squalene synthase family protein [Beggiatoa leptomitoformis]ALG67777.1 phytoene synthase [Beggiatoa leptomitoformis]QGX04082.1 phytoene synthase [Beggiatoa leptomitoformis]